jgi:hypothetical protein
MSNLEFPIRALQATLSIISAGRPKSAKDFTEKGNQLIGIDRAIKILGEYKHSDEREERKKEKKLNSKNIKL